MGKSWSSNFENFLYIEYIKNIPRPTTTKSMSFIPLGAGVIPKILRNASRRYVSSYRNASKVTMLRKR